MSRFLKPWHLLVGRDPQAGPRIASSRERFPDSSSTMAAWPEIESTERSALLVEALQLSGRLRLRVYGESMLPALWPGDIAEVEACCVSEVRRGDIVLAARGGRLYLHRFLGHCPDGGFVLRGDSMASPDPVFTPDAFLAKLVSAASPRRKSGSLVLGWSRALGFIFCYCGIARRLALRWHHRWNAQQSPESRLSDSRGTA